MTHGLRACRHNIGRAPVASFLLAPLLLALPCAVQAQVAQSDDAPQAAPVIDQSLDAMPDIGLDWPDMDQADSITPLPDDPADVEVASPDAPAPTPAVIDPADAAAIATDLAADTGDERRYMVQLTGIDAVANAQFTQRFDELSALRLGQDKSANLAQINRRIKEDSDLLDRLLRAKGYYAARIRGAVTAPAGGQRPAWP